MKDYLVKQGDTWISIAADHGFYDWRKVADHPDNEVLVKKRPHYGLLRPGDLIRIPPVEVKVEDLATNTQHRFRVLSHRASLRVLLRDTGGRSLADMDVEVEFSGRETSSETTTAEGLLELELPAGVRSVRVRVGGQDLEFQASHLDPVNTASGVQGRLQGLGYNSGRLDGRFGAKTRAALAAFQRDQNAAGASLEISGLPDEDTLTALFKTFDEDEDEVGELDIELEEEAELPPPEPDADQGPGDDTDDITDDDVEVDDSWEDD